MVYGELPHVDLNTSDLCENCRYPALFASLCTYEGKRVCYACQRQAQGNPAQEHHHILGRDYPYTVPLPANMHREITALQQRWPDALKHPNNPLLVFAALVRIIADLSVWSATWLGVRSYRLSDWLLVLSRLLDEHLPAWQDRLAPLWGI
jgi:hypothetical protein